MSIRTQIVVVGGGIGGLTAAYLLKRKFNSAAVTIIEQSRHLGGLLTSYDYGEFGRFDCGMHWITETSIPVLDEFFVHLLPLGEWQFLAGARRDLSGLFYRGRLQQNSQYPDVREFGPEQYRACVDDFWANLGLPVESPSNTLGSYARARFGPLIADSVVSPIAEKVHGASADELDVMAQFLPLLDRVVMFDEPYFRELMTSTEVRARLAFPEQRSLPLEYSSGRRSFYPRQYGIYRVIEALTKRLENLGIEIISRAQVVGLDVADRRIGRLWIEQDGVRREFGDLERLVWTVAAWPLAKLLDLPPPEIGHRRRRRTVIVNLLLKHPPHMGDLYCFFCADEPYATYRVTHYGAFCPEAPRAGGHPICVELLVDDAPSRSGHDYCQQAIREIEAFGLVSSPQEVLFARAEPLVSGFPSVMRQNIVGLDNVRSAFEEARIDNLTRAGILAESGVFFQHDVLSDIYRKVERL